MDPAESQSPRPMLPIEHSTQSEYSVLQVVSVEHEKLPSLQVVPDDSKEAIIDDDKYHDPDGAESPSSDDATKEVVTLDSTLPEAVQSLKPSSPLPWYKNRRSKAFQATATILFIIVILAIILGAVLGTRSNRNTSQSSDNSTLRQKSACNNTICPQILTAAVLGLNSTKHEERKLFVFARGNGGTDTGTGTIYFNWAALSSLNSNDGWPSTSKWSALMGGGQFISQPSAMAWNLGDRISVAAVTDNNNLVQMTRFALDPGGPNKNNFTVDGWLDLGGPVGSSLATCAINGTRGDFYAAGGSKFLHNLSHRNGTVDMWKHPQQFGVEAWDDGDDLGFEQTSRPGVVCRRSEWVHDLVFYDKGGKVRHGMWAWKVPGDHWTEYVDLGGRFVGEPSVIAVGSGRVDFFGIGEGDKGMWHFTWTEEGNHTVLEDLGGQFHSSASAVATGLGDSEDFNVDVRIDVVGLGTDDHVYHRVMKGMKWVSEWEDLGIEGNSAPLLVHYGIVPQTPERVGLFVVGYDGQVKQATWTVGDELSWKGLRWTSMGGAMTSDFYRFS